MRQNNLRILQELPHLLFTT